MFSGEHRCPLGYLLNTPRTFWSSPVTWLGDFVSQNHTDRSLMVKSQNDNASTGLGGGGLAPVYSQLTENFRNKQNSPFNLN